MTILFTVALATALVLETGWWPGVNPNPSLVQPLGSGSQGEPISQPEGGSKPQSDPQPALGSGVAGGVNSAPGVVVGPGTLVKYEIRYTTCDCTESEEASPDSLLGKDLKAVRAAVPDYEVNLFTQDYVVFRKNVDTLCPEMDRYRHVTIKDGQVAVFYGKPPHLKLEYSTGLPAVQLRTEDLERLTAGVTVEGEEAALTLLEGLSE